LFFVFFRSHNETFPHGPFLPPFSPKLGKSNRFPRRGRANSTPFFPSFLDFLFCHVGRLPIPQPTFAMALTNPDEWANVTRFSSFPFHLPVFFMKMNGFSPFFFQFPFASSSWEPGQLARQDRVKTLSSESLFRSLFLLPFLCISLVFNSLLSKLELRSNVVFS